MIARDLKRERAIALSLGPRKVWRPGPERRPARIRSSGAREWLRRAELEQQELAGINDLCEPGGVGEEF